MKLADKIEDTLDGKWSGLHGEVVTNDCYRVRNLDFVPDIVFDIGANVGTFSRFARELWPDATIVAVEPHPENAAHFRKFAGSLGTFLREEAIGSGAIYRCDGAANGSGEVYMAEGVGYPLGKIVSNPRFSKVPTESILLDELIEIYWTPGMLSVIKIDCEGAENHILGHPPSLEILRQMDYVAMEIHRYAADGAEQEAVNKTIRLALDSMKETHSCKEDGVHFWARKI